MTRRRSDTWELRFTPDERRRLRLLLRLRAEQVAEEDQELLRRYWSLQRERSRGGGPRVRSARVNEDFRAWLRDHGHPVYPFSRKLYDLWRSG